jgi:oxalate decarboxylase/phosphoglucose isomerase-like protein (cupin superfamily)
VLLLENSKTDPARSRRALPATGPERSEFMSQRRGEKKMSTMVSTGSSAGSLQASLKSHIGRHAAKSFDWDAFPANRAYRELMRGQMRYVGAGGSPKIDDVSTLAPEHFTVSLIHQPVGTYAAAHSHEVEEAFLVLNGILTVGWEENGEVVEIRLGPKDMILNSEGIAHGFRNDGVEPVLMSIMVGAARPLAPQYRAHPKDVGPERALRFGANPGRTIAFDSESDHPLQRRMAANVVRFSALKPHWDPASVARMVYIGASGIPPRNTRKELVTVPKGCSVRAYSRTAEETFLVLDGCLTVGWSDGATTVEERLGPKDLVFTPGSRTHYFRNDGVSDAQFFMVIGSAAPEDVTFLPA